MKYNVTIKWQAMGYYTAEVYADSEAEAIELARQEDDGDLTNQQVDYQEYSAEAEHEVECERCNDTGVISDGVSYDGEKPCIDCQE